MTREPDARKSEACRLLRGAACFAVFFCLLAACQLPAQEGGQLLTNASQILSLPAEQAARGVPVLVRGVVTAAEPNWEGRFFVQDASGGVFVDKHNSTPPTAGDLVEVSGVSHPGAFAPTITKPHWRKLGAASLPAAKPVSFEQLMSGTEDSQRIEVTGIVRAVEADTSRFHITLTSGDYRLPVYLPVIHDMDPKSLVGALVRMRGTAAASYNAQLRHLLSMILYVPQAGDFIVEKPELADPFTEPILPLNNIAQYHKDNAPDQRVHVKGTVTYQRPGQDVFLKDASGGLHVKSQQREVFQTGDVIEAVGFPGLENYLPVLQDATFLKTTEPRAMVVAQPVSISDLQKGLHHADFVKVEGNLLDRSLRPISDPKTRQTGVKTVLLLQSSNFSFTAEAETPAENTGLNSIPFGSRIEVSGVCLTESGDDFRFKSLQVLLPTPGSFRILSQPSWLTPRRLAIALGVFFLVSVVAVSWIIMISRKNSELNLLIREKEKAKAELQNAHDQLEARVKERTEQLKIQIAARKESELQFKGVVAERTRLAQELHDTLEQALASIALQLDTSAKLFPKDTGAANYHFEIGRNILAQSQADVRRSVWDLRSRALEQFNLRGALIASSRQITDGTGINVEVATTGAVRPLPEIIEDNLLRIAQEALTNIIKHSHATHAVVELEYGPQTICLQIEDNGNGFATGDCPGPREGHFGLLGISERTQRLGGRHSLTSTPGSGTIVRVEIPIEGAQDVRSAAVTELQIG
jgi:signal transduction histidine kinase